MPNGGPIKQVTYLFDYFDYNLFGIKLVNALNALINQNMAVVAIGPGYEWMSQLLT
jgi:hypothetical protein